MNEVFPFLTLRDARHVRLTCRDWYRATQTYPWSWPRLTRVCATVPAPISYPEWLAVHDEHLLVANRYAPHVHVVGPRPGQWDTGLSNGVIGLRMWGAHVVAMTYAQINILAGIHDPILVSTWRYTLPHGVSAMTVVQDSVVIVNHTLLTRFTMAGVKLSAFGTRTQERCISVTTVGAHVAVADAVTHHIHVIALDGRLCHRVPFDLRVSGPYLELGYWAETDEWVVAQMDGTCIMVDHHAISSFRYPWSLVKGRGGMWVVNRNHHQLCWVAD